MLQATVGSRPPGGSVGTSSPTWASTNTPVPYVAFTRPGTTQPAPARAACWSTTRPRSGSSTGQDSWLSVPRSPIVSRTSGRTSGGTPKRWHSHGSKPGVPSVCSCVREAVEASVANPAPRRSHRNESTVPMRRRPSSRAFATSSSCSSSQASLAAEKYGSKGRPLRRLISSSSSAMRSRTSCERLSCHTTMGLSGAPVSASHARTDSP